MRRRGPLREPILRLNLPGELGAGSLSQFRVEDPSWWGSLLHGMSYHRLDQGSATLFMRWSFNSKPVEHDTLWIRPLNTDQAHLRATGPVDILDWADISVEGAGRLVVMRVPEDKTRVVHVFAQDEFTVDTVRAVAMKTGLCRAEDERSPFIGAAAVCPSLGAFLAMC